MRARRFAACRMGRGAWRLLRAVRGATSLEMALVFPTFLLFIFGMFAAYSMISCRRAMDYGIEKALRYAVVHGGNGTSGTTAVKSAFTSAANIVWTGVGTSSVVTVTPATFKAGDTVTVAVSYAWSAPTSVHSTSGTLLFTAVTLTASAAMRVVN